MTSAESESSIHPVKWQNHIDSIINADTSGNRKCNGLEKAHNVLQIRASMVSQEWSEKWLRLPESEKKKQLNNYLFHIKYLLPPNMNPSRQYRR